MNIATWMCGILTDLQHELDELRDEVNQLREN